MEKVYTLNVTEAVANQILNALGALPFNQVVGTMNNLYQQIGQQNQPEPQLPTINTIDNEQDHN